MKWKNTVRNITGILLISLSCTAIAEDTLFKLDNRQLDAISAGYVELTVTASSFAAGTDVVALAYASTDIRSNRNGRTVARGSAISTAIGEIISTETGYTLNTDENIISLRAIQRISNSEGTLIIKMRVHRDGRVTVTTTQRPARNGRGNRGRSFRETNTLRVRAVTRR